ncbi:MAG: hypothetical protein SFZ24_07570 [Planctomycetota bacterium]|nr:hypothetical protein [Planctomycetota bacterium]
MTPATIVLIVVGSVLGLVVFIIAAVPVVKGIGWLIAHVARFVYSMVSDMARLLGGLITAVIFVPMILLNIVIGRWSAAGHFGRAFQDEFVGVGHCVYRLLISHPARLLGLSALTEGIEQRLPQAMAQAPGADRPSGRTGQFEGYRIVGSLQGGGSGGRLYVAEPDDRKKAAFARSGRTVEQVVIKSFSLADGSSLPQIIRESRALEAAKKLGLILDHELTDQRFFYVMEYIPGDSLTVVTKRLHSEAGPEGLTERQLGPVMGMIADLLGELDRYHRGGLWHKDVKPDNIIINKGRAFLVDLGLITPLRSAMTLTTHGTEYFRDPEMVRMALRGAKVNEVDGVKFDIYGVGAVLFAVIENSFPAHGGLSQFSKSCPEALRWIVRRAMTDLHNRYASAGEMLADLRTVLGSADPFMVKPVDLPSVRGGGAGAVPPPMPEVDPMVAGVAAAGAAARKEREGFVFDVKAGIGAGAGGERPAAGGEQGGKGRGSRSRPAIAVADWWTGRYDAVGAAPAAGAGAGPGAGAGERAEDARRTPRRHAGKSAAAQLEAAQERVRRAQERVGRRMSRGATHTSFARRGKFSSEPNPGVAAAFFIFLGAAVFGAFMTIRMAANNRGPASAPALAAGEVRIETDGGTVRLGPTMEETIRRGFVATGTEDDWVFDHAQSAGSIQEEVARAMRDATPDERDRLVDAINRFGEKATVTIEKLRTRLAQFERGMPGGMSGVGAGARHDEDGDVAVAAPAPVKEIVGGDFSSGSVLILDMVPEGADPPLEDTLKKISSKLRERWYRVLGEGGEGGADDVEMQAAARRVIELSGPDDAQAVERVRRWLADEPGVDSVLWIGTRGDNGRTMLRLVSRPTFDESSLRAALTER